MRNAIALLVSTLLLVACSGSGDDGPATTRSQSSTSVQDTATTATAQDTTTSAPAESTPLDTRMEWVADVLTAGELEESTYQATFTGDFIQAVSYDEFVAVVQQISSAGGAWEVAEFESRDNLSGVAVLASSGGESVRADLTLEATPPYRIAGLRMQPAETPTLDDPPGDLDEAASRLAELGDLELAVMEAETSECAPVFEAGDGGAMPIGSAFKLYVLGAVADAVEAGEVSWSEDVAITEEHRSIPTGVLQDEEAGETFSVREMAETMIAFSDNTGTDHLIGLVGREAVESAFEKYGMEEPALNIPLMDTMDFAALKVGPASGLATQWLDADEEGRRQILEQISDISPADIPLLEFDRPIHPDTIEWFATPSDVCRVLVQLVDQGEPITQILSINPGLPDEEGAFEYIAFKGGSEPGLVAMNWLVERPDGRRFVVSGSVVNPEGLDQLEATLLFGAVRNLIADL